jgi:uncharacterized protein (DUF58 family)
MLLEPAARRRLDALTLAAPQVRAGAQKGERRSIRRGTSIEFADYRDYAPGDDLRHLDWNAYGRLDRPLVRLYEDEEDLAVHILIDASASMAETADPDAPPVLGKFAYAQRLAAACAYIALRTNDRLTVAALRAGAAAERIGPVRGRAASARAFAFVENVQPGGTTDLNAALRAYALNARPGLAVLVSDGFSPAGWLDGVSALTARGSAVVWLHVLSAAEIDPPYTGDLRLIDQETGSAQEVSVDAAMRARYRERLDAWRESLRAGCRTRGAVYLPISTATPWESVILREMRRSGVIR